MKSFVNRIVLAFLISAMAGALALGKNQKETVSFPDNLKISGTLVKSGTYQVSFDEQTNELTIMKSGKVIAKTTAKVEKRATKARTTEIRTNGGSDGVELIGIAFEGSDQNIVLGQSSAAAKN